MSARNIGSMTARVAVRGKVQTPDGYGGFVRNDEQYAGYVWASITPMSSRETVYASQLGQRTTHVMRCWDARHIAHGVTVEHGGVAYYVERVERELRSGFVTAYLREGVPE